LVEQLRLLRSQLVLRWFNAEQRGHALAVTSTRRSEGRSFIAANLAVVFSQLGGRALLIDADLRNPCQAKLFRLKTHVGLSTLLAGRAGHEAIVRIPGIMDLSVLPAGAEPPNPQELLGRAGFAELLNELAAEFDVVVIDTPPSADYADAQMVAARAGAALLVARNNFTRAAEVSQLAVVMQQSGAAVLGAVLNNR
jgi:chain length determinant protein tyrosine kinase EpsG